MSTAAPTAPATSYDYIIIGGGTAGLVLANRLSEDSSVSVAVLEAGGDATADPRTVVPALFTSALGSELDWNYAMVPQVCILHFKPFLLSLSLPFFFFLRSLRLTHVPLQKGLNNRLIGHNQGKALGGSSVINAQALIPFSATDIDVWESLVGATGWNFATLAPYLEKAFSLVLPADAETTRVLNASWARDWASKASGPVHASFVDVKENPIIPAWLETFGELGYPLTASPFTGKSMGPYVAPSTVEGRSKTRSYSATAYYQPAAKRSNLKVITGATVSRIVTEKKGNRVVATGVKYTTDSSSSEVTLQASKEVIFSAGALNSPKILELSGIGDPAVLKAAGVDVVVENPYVGTNLQDHVQCAISFEAVDGFPTGDDLLRGDANAVATAQQQYADSQSGPLANSGLTQFAYLPTVDFKSDTGALSNMLSDLKKAKTSHPLDAARIQHVSNLLSSGKEGTAQYFLFSRRRR
jgi:choline dehydrogenase-like flavoprotein